MQSLDSFLRFTFYFLPLILLACSPTDNSWERVQNTGVLTVGLDPTFPPFENGETGELHGLDVDLAQSVGASLEVEVAFHYFGYDGLYDALATEQVDVLISALVIDITKTRDFSYSEPYFNAGQILITRRDAAELDSMSALSNQTVAVELGSEGHIQAIEWAKRVPNVTILTRNTPDEALQAILEGAAEAALVDQVSGRLFLVNAPALTVRDAAVTVEPYALVVRSHDKQLLTQLYKALAQLKSSGELEKIITKWLGSNPG